MGNVDTKLSFRKAFCELSTRAQPVESEDEEFWEQFWSDSGASPADVFALLPPTEIRQLRDEHPNNLATLCYKCVEKLVKAVDTSCRTSHDQQTALNSVRLLSRLVPYLFEDADWRNFFWSSLPPAPADDEETLPLAKALLTALCDLLFCPDFTVSTNRRSGPDRAEDLQSVDSCEYIWEAGVGFAHSPSHVAGHDSNRTEILKLLLACFSETIYAQPAGEGLIANKWIEYFSSGENRHALPLFTSLLNVVCSYDPVGIGLPYNHLLFGDSREGLVETALQVLIVILDHDTNNSAEEDTTPNMDNLFINYISRVHREEDFYFILRGFTKLLNNPLTQTYLPNSTKKVQFHQELLILFWKICDYNKKFLYFVLKSSDVLEILVPILFHLNDSRADQSRVGLMHIGVFILLLLSGERNFGVRLNKPFTLNVPMDIPVFSGTHADLMVVVFHKIITTGHQRLQPLFDCLLTVLVNVSPYLKTLSMVAATKLLHFLEAFSTPWFLFSSPANHHLVFFLLEIFNNIIQYQFDGNSNLVYTIIRKRHVFHGLANLATDSCSISRSLLRKSPLSKEKAAAAAKEKKDKSKSRSARSSRRSAGPGADEDAEDPSGQGQGSSKGRPGMERKPSTESNTSSQPELDSPLASPPTSPTDLLGSFPALQGSEGVCSGGLKVSLPKTPGIDKMTERESAHPTQQTLNQLTRGGVSSGSSSGGAASANLMTHPDLSEPPPTKSSQEKSPVKEKDKSSMMSRSKSMPLSQTLEQTPAGQSGDQQTTPGGERRVGKVRNLSSSSSKSFRSDHQLRRTFSVLSTGSERGGAGWAPSPEWVQGWKGKLPLQTVMRLLQVLVPQVEKICIDKGLTDESEILRFLQHGTLVGLLPVPHPILIRKYQANSGTTAWFRTYMWGVLYLRNMNPPIWFDTKVKLFEIQRL